MKVIIHPSDSISTSILSDYNLNRLLSAVAANCEISDIVFDVNDITVLNTPGMEPKLKTFQEYYPTCSVITDLSTPSPVPDWLYHHTITDVTIRWNNNNKNYDNVFHNISSFFGDINIQIIATNEVVLWSANEIQKFVDICNTTDQIKSVEVIPHTTTQYSTVSVPFTKYEQLIKRWLRVSPESTRSYRFTTENKIKEVLAGNGYAWSDEEIHIIADGYLAVKDFDGFDRQFYSAIFDFVDFRKAAIDEHLMLSTNSFCNTCRFKGTCLSSQLQCVYDLTNSCNGFIRLLEWYEKTYT